MEKQEIEQLVKEMLATTVAELTTTVNSSINGAVTKLSKDTQAKLDAIAASKTDVKDDAKTPGDLSVQALQQEMAALKAEREAEKKDAIAAKRQNALLQDLGGRKLNASGVLQKVLLTEYGDKLEESNGAWYVKDGETVTPLSKVVDTFLASPDGLVFTPPASNVNGNDSKAGNVRQKTEQPKGLADLMTEALATK